LVTLEVAKDEVLMRREEGRSGEIKYLASTPQPTFHIGVVPINPHGRSALLIS
jgi:hypothetical protein